MTVPCFACGYEICDRHRQGDSTRWLEEFRLVTNHDGLGTSVSGIGAMSDLGGRRWIAPLDYAKHWADMEAPTTAEVGVMLQDAVEGRHGYPIHAACWELAQKVFAPDEINPSTLFSVLNSLPAASEATGLDWGHMYGGLLIADDDHRDPDVSGNRRVRRIDSEDRLAAIARHNPLDTIRLETLNCRKPENPVPVPAVMARCRIGSRDPFAMLPPELRLLVACELPTSDVARIRLASRAFRFVFDENQFWASRFTTIDERRWVFEATEWLQRTESNGQPLDWRVLYHQTGAPNSSASLQNRERIWRLLEDARDVIFLRCFEARVEFRNWLIPEELEWTRETAEIHWNRRREPTFTAGCRLFHTQQVLIPDTAATLEVFLVRLGNEDYVTGLAFRQAQGEAVALGYESSRSQVVDLQTRLSGIKVAIGKRGVRGLRCVFEDGTMSERVGDWVSVSQTDSLVTAGPIVALEVGYDGCKIVRLSIGKAVSLVGDAT
ncbi:F-box domain containing protein [Purpureocillium lilacinum]|uniref:F-box domain containing protein n=2 Tax=Purpureocillium lilacinum TaxID=33203 RepID=A0A2U3ELT8_PURLI|nr:hypothetical protein Purlil1_7418 [Purpureocillium lilacinum]PWI75465.1 F-box domain containing protein [Purpureocillium lilacinum]